MTRILVAVFVAGCTVSTATDRQPIIGGTPAAGDVAVVMLAAYPSNLSTLFTCTAEVISPTALLTVAHCLDHTSDYSYGVYFAADASAYPTLVDLMPQLAPVASVHMHPNYDPNTPFTADIGVVNLTTATTITPLDFARDAPTAGVSARIVGYGQVVYNTFNETREQATTTVAAIDAGDTITVGDGEHLTCVGDSGGPALVGGTIVGVDSYSDTTGCTQPAHFRRTDMYAPFIDQYAGTSPPAGSIDAGVPESGGDAGTTEPGDHGGGCATGSGSGLAIALLVPFVRRRRRSAQ